MTAPDTTATIAGPKRKPRDDEIDVHGVTHPGKVRPENQDHFLVCALKKHMVVRMTSLPELDGVTAEPERLAFLMMVADGVGGGAKGEEASRKTVEAVAQYVSQSMSCYYAAGSSDDQAFFEALQEGALRCHEELLRRGREDPQYRGMATTLTLYLGMWPRAYLLQVGDSRAYLLHQGKLAQITRDQTMAQELIDIGVIKPGDTANNRLAHTLSSSIGGRQTAPAVTRHTVDWGTVALICSDGLTNHVSNERIREVLRSMTSAQQACEDLLQEALEGGGTDNITLIVARALPKEGR